MPPKGAYHKGKRKRKKRKCLRCGKEFLSEGPHNRLCSSCKKINESIGYLPAKVASDKWR